jgi:hypothetical protein
VFVAQTLAVLIEYLIEIEETPERGGGPTGDSAVSQSGCRPLYGVVVRFRSLFVGSWSAHGLFVSGGDIVRMSVDGGPRRKTTLSTRTDSVH